MRFAGIKKINAVNVIEIVSSRDFFFKGSWLSTCPHCSQAKVRLSTVVSGEAQSLQRKLVADDSALIECVSVVCVSVVSDPKKSQPSLMRE